MISSEEDGYHTGAAVGALLFISAVIVLLIATAIIGRKILIADAGRRDVLHAEAEATSLAAKAHAMRTMGAAQVAMSGFANAVKAQGATVPAAGQIERMLAEYKGDFNNEFWLLFIDADGFGVAASEDLPVKGVSYAERDYFKAHATNTSSNVVHVGSLVRAKQSSQRAFVLSRKVVSGDGRFVGVIAAPMNVTPLAEALRIMRINRNAWITLKDRNGRVIARAGPEDDSTREPEADGVDFLVLNGDALPAIQMLASPETVGWVRSERSLEPLPLTVAVEIPSEIWTPDLKADLVVGSAGLLFMSGVLLLSGCLAMRLNTRLKRSEARYRQLYSSLQDGVVLVDGVGRIEDCNQAFLDLTGCSRDELTGSSFARWAPPSWRVHDDPLHAKRDLGNVLKFGAERDYIQKSGRIVHVNIKMWRVRKAGRGLLFCALVRDVSEGRRAQKMQQDVNAALERKVQQRTLELTHVISLMKSEIAERKAIEDKLRHSQEQLRKLAARREDIREGERQRIAREIHDELGGFLTVIKANISVARSRAGQTAEADTLLGNTTEIVDRAIDALRRVIADLRPSVLDHLGVWAALKWYTGQIRERTGLDCACVIDEGLNSFCLKSDHETMIFRIAQEALTNVVRHANATSATVRAFRARGNLVVEVEDNGKGIEAQRLLDEESWGILGMHERTRHFGGELRISGLPGQGTIVVLRIPLEESDVLQEDQVVAC